jgi:hypothetical protein
MIDLFVLSAVLSRVTTRLAAGAGKDVDKELMIARAFAAQARVRMDQNFARIDDNDDELVKALADHAVANEGYGWDVL